MLLMGAASLKETALMRPLPFPLPASAGMKVPEAVPSALTLAADGCSCASSTPLQSSTKEGIFLKIMGPAISRPSSS